jgi:branched-chain amino acid transport system ATP-binding protein
MLEIADLAMRYGRIEALRGIDLTVAAGELVALVGANGAGKSTLLHVIAGLQPASRGRIEFAGADITKLPAEARVRLGIVQVPEGRQVFSSLSVEDNLRLGAFTRRRAEADAGLEAAYDRFPILRERRRSPAGALSGGQQQMLAIARALMARPRLLLLDEPSMGLSPLLVDEIFEAVLRLRAEGTTVFLVEQNAAAALSVADRGYVLETGRVILAGDGRSLLRDERVKSAYLGA